MFAKIRHRRQSHASNAGPTWDHDDERPVSIASSSVSKSSGARLVKGPNPASVPRGAQPQSPLHFKTFHTGGSAASLPPPSRPFAGSDRPSTSDGNAASTSLYANPTASASSVSLLPPVLPPIPRIASVYGKPPTLTLFDFEARAQDRETGNISEGTDESIPAQSNAALPSSTAYTASPRVSSLPGFDQRPASNRMDPQFFSGGPTESIMQATMFPPAPPKSPARQDVQNRAFVDSRDRSYYPIPPKRLASSESHPPRTSSMLSTGPSYEAGSALLTPPAGRSPGANESRSTSSVSSVPSVPAPTASLAPLENASILSSRPTSALPLSTSRNPPEHALSPPHRPGLRSSGSDSNLESRAQAAQPLLSPAVTASDASSPASPSPDGTSSTLGTPYHNTFASFPLPQHVERRPQTSGLKASVAGIEVPTHHTSSTALRIGSKPEPKRKTRLLRPMAFLSRKRSGQDVESSIKLTDHERSAQEQAFAQQKNVAATGIKKKPEDFDPRIKGNVVHDFSSPRRNTRTSSIAFGDNWSQHSSGTGPTFDNTADQPSSSHAKQTSVASSRLSTHSPVFREHLSENTDTDHRSSLLNAESRENKDFVQRASRQSVHTLSHDSSVLPPFARRSQQLDPLQTAADADAQRSSASSSHPTTHSKQDSALSSSSLVSPITARNSATLGFRNSASPVSPASVRLSFPVEGADKQLAKGSNVSSAELFRQGSNFQASISDRPPVARDGIPPPQLRLEQLSPGPAQSPGSPEYAEESPFTVAKRAVSDRGSKSPPSPSEKRRSAAKRSLIGSTPKHHASNASRFSFQIGERNAEEAALEEKHRKTVRPAEQSAARPFSPDEDEDDYFDEDAMDDMDEMEMQEHQGFNSQHSLAPPTATEPWSMQDAQRQMREESDDDSNDSLYEQRPDTSYSWQPSPNEELPTHHFRMASNASQSTLGNSIMGKFPVHSVPKTGGFYMHSDTAYRQQPSSDVVQPGVGLPHGQRPPLPHRDSGSSEQNRVASGLSFPSRIPAGPPQQLSAATVAQQPVPTIFSAFNFEESDDLQAFHSRPASMIPNHRAQDSETLPTSGHWSDLQQNALDREPSLQRPLTAGKGKESAPYQGLVGAGIRARYADDEQNLQNLDDAVHSVEDDLYFDDGGFEQDIRRPPSAGKPLNEDVFDDPTFLKTNGHRPSYSRALSDMTVASMSSDGPYPSFAMGSNSARVLQRQSQLLLEDLPLQGANDPALIPQRNPSEDAKRLGRSLKVPPLPPPAGNKEAQIQMQQSLEAYHNALADAANRAAEEGRFVRAPSISTIQSDGMQDERSDYPMEVKADKGPEKTLLKRGLSLDTSVPTIEQQSLALIPKMSFDFGFENTFGGDASFDDYDNGDDDIIAAANAEALAIDEDGFYGQEFDFYAKARPTSSDAESVNGGFFGEDGDDGLGRNMTFREPNLTPITERSEFSTRNSFVHMGHGALYGPASAGPLGPNSPSATRLPISPLLEHEATLFDQLRQLRNNAFGASSGSLASDGKGTISRPLANQSPTLGARLPVFAPQHHYFPVSAVESSGSSNSSPVGRQSQHYVESPKYGGSPSYDVDATPRKGGLPSPETPRTVRKASSPSVATPTAMPAEHISHSRKNSDSVTYVREEDPSGSGQPRWVLERRRASQQGQLELVGREVVQNGWI